MTIDSARTAYLSLLINLNEIVGKQEEKLNKICFGACQTIIS